MPSFLPVQVPVEAAVTFTLWVVTVMAGYRICMANRLADFASAGSAVVRPGDCFYRH